MSQVILIMIDGLGADYVRDHPTNLPNLMALAGDGLLVERLATDTPGTSLPGRTSLLTGAPPSEHGIYGNLIWDDGRFRYANPSDVRLPTLPGRAREAGLDTAVMGFGMVRPEDAAVFAGPWWANEMLQRARDEEPIPADEEWLRTSRHPDATGRLAALVERGFPDGVPDAYAGGAVQYLMAEVTGDRNMLRWSAGLASSDRPPDLLLSEILLPDSVQHVAGQGHHFSDWAIGYADDLVGTLVAELRLARRLDDTTLIVTSDHGHGTVESAIYTDRLLPGRAVACEGSVLIAAVYGEADARELERLLAGHDVTPLARDLLPPERRGELALFTAPDGFAFQTAPSGAAVDSGAEARPAAGPDEVIGPPKYRSSHGFRPGHAADERFAVIAGPGISRRLTPRAEAGDIAATVEDLLGLQRRSRGQSLL